MAATALSCAYCPDIILPGANHTTDPVAHPLCAFRERQRLETAEADMHRADCLCDDPFCPAEPTPVSRYVRRLRAAFKRAGLAGCVLWYPEHDTDPHGNGRRWSESPGIQHSEFALSDSHAWSDVPARIPGSLIVAQTPCPAADLGQPDAGPARTSEVPRLYKCRFGHVHHGQSPYGRDGIPEEVRRRVSESLESGNRNGRGGSGKLGAVYDETLAAEVRDQLRDQGLDEDAVEESIAAMRDAGMLDVPGW